MDFKLNDKGGWIIPPQTTISDDTKIPAWSTLDYGCKLGNGCTLGDYCTLGYGCTLGDRCTLGGRCTLGYGCKLGNGCTIAYTAVDQFVTLGNVDGSGRQILLIRTGTQITVLAGCFKGSVDEFVKRAKDEKKLVYAAVIPAVAKALITHTTKRKT